jgi:DNA-binding transcriptional regulator LsrR (DeoR family)
MRLLPSVNTRVTIEQTNRSNVRQGGFMAIAKKPARLVLTASVARRYYLDGKSQVEIAGELNLSRFQVARLLEAARANGLVRIEIPSAGAIDVELSGRLQDAYGLRHAIVVDTPHVNPASLLPELGEAAAELLTEITTADDVLGLAWSRAVSAMTNALTTLPGVPVVQITGALARLDMADTSVDLVRQAARKSGGPAHFFYAPTIVPDARTARALRQQPEVARAFARFSTVTKAVVGVGLWAPSESTVYDATDEKGRAALEAHGVCAEVSGVLVDAEGQPVDSALGQRIIGVSASQLREIPEVIGIVYNSVRTPAIRAAILGGLVNGIVTHPPLARQLIAQR